MRSAARLRLVPPASPRPSPVDVFGEVEESDESDVDRGDVGLWREDLLEVERAVNEMHADLLANVARRARGGRPLTWREIWSRANAAMPEGAAERLPVASDPILASPGTFPREGANAPRGAATTTATAPRPPASAHRSARGAVAEGLAPSKETTVNNAEITRRCLAALADGPKRFDEIVAAVKLDPSVVRLAVLRAKTAGAARVTGMARAARWELVDSAFGTPAPPRSPSDLEDEGPLPAIAAAAPRAITPALAHPHLGEHGPAVDALIAERAALERRVARLNRAIAALVEP